MSGKDKMLLLEGSENTAFRYRIDGGMDERDKDEIECMDSGYVLGPNWPSIVSESVDLRHRMGYVRRRNLGFSFICVADPGFESSLVEVDPRFPRALAYMVADFYRDGTSRVSDLLENVTRRNPCGFGSLRETDPYGTMMNQFLTGLYGKPLNGIFEKSFFDRIPADRFGCASISGDRREGYRTELVLQISLRV